MKKIFKYKLETTDKQTLSIPEGAEILSVQTQEDKPCIWVLVDDGNVKIDRQFYIYGTGHSITSPETKKFIGTYQVCGGMGVFHLFEELGI